MTFYQFFIYFESILFFFKFELFIVSPQADGAGNKDGDEPVEEEVVTKPPLTGIPQIDYVWDPNLPRELNGYGSITNEICGISGIYLDVNEYYFAPIHSGSIYLRIHF